MPAETINGFRLSPQQSRLWLSLPRFDSPWARCTIGIQGPLDAERLKHALNVVIGRHEILRTSYQKHPEMTMPVQVVRDEVNVSWQELDGGRDISRAASVNELLPSFSTSVFEKQDQLVHAFLQSNSPTEHKLLLALPRLSVDSASLANLAKELATAMATDSAADDDDPPLQYVQFSEWQYEILSDEDSAEGLRYWEHQAETLASDERKHVTIGRSVDDASCAGAWHILPAAVCAKLLARVADHNLALDDYLFCCWAVVQWKLSGQSPLLTANVTNGRQHEVLESAMGVFAKGLPISTRLQRDMPFNELLGEVAESRIQAAQWQEYYRPQDSSPDGSVVAPWLTTFEYRETPEFDSSTNRLTMTLLEIEAELEPADVGLQCVLAGQRLSFRCHSNTRELCAADMERIAKHLAVLVSDSVAHPAACVGELEVFDAADREEILGKFNRSTLTDADSVVDTAGETQLPMLEELIGEHAGAHPDRVALDFQGHQLTFAELHARSNRLGNHLKELGVGPDVVVGVCVERSLEMVVAALAIMKSGGAYLPLDPGSPTRRIDTVVRDAQVHVLISQETHRKHLPNFAGPLFMIDRDWHSLSDGKCHVPQCDARADNLAYVIYTSGSTGHPKGVMIRRSSVTHLLSALRSEVYRSDDETVARRISCNAPFTFDACVKQLVQLAAGHTLIILPEEVRPDGSAMVEFVKQQQIDTLDCTPIQLRLMLDSGSPLGLDHKLKVLVGGDALDAAMWERLVVDHTTNKTQFFNVYGPTESTVDATVCEISSLTPTPSIGRSLNGVETYVLDDVGDIAPIGRFGELHIAGLGLARGYLRQPGLTAAQFVPNPHGTAGERMYRTGDLAAYQPGGDLVFRGRIDHQVKIRGNRVELGEIESVLLQHPTIGHVAVVVREDRPGDQRLVAYVTPHAGEAVDDTELRAYLRDRLADYMVPALFVTLDELPVTRHGKVDRAALPSPENHRPRQKVAFVSPESETEEAIARIWQQVLGVDQVGVEDNFFDLGGHSLLLVQVHVRLREHFKSEISLIEMFRNPTVRALSKFLTSATQSTSNEPTAYDRAQSRAARRRRSRRGEAATISTEE